MLSGWLLGGNKYYNDADYSVQKTEETYSSVLAIGGVKSLSLHWLFRVVVQILKWLILLKHDTS